MLNQISVKEQCKCEIFSFHFHVGAHNKKHSIFLFQIDC